LCLSFLLAGCKPKPESRPARGPEPESTKSVSARPKYVSSPAVPGPDSYAARDEATLPEKAVSTGATLQPNEKGMWVWHQQFYANPGERAQLLEFCKQEGITRLLVQIHYEMDRSTGAVRRLSRPEELAALVRQAREAGIAVEALEGDPQWALRARQGSFWEKFEALLAWNESQPPESRLAGIHLDIEPYLLAEYKSEEKPRVMLEYLELLAEVRKRIDGRGLLLAADIPFWYDSRAKEEPDHHIISFNGKEQYLSRHVQDICDYVAVMSYRQKAVGGNSVTSVCEDELAYAEQIGKKVFASLETAEVSDTPTISFFGTTPQLFREQLGLIQSSLGSRPGFGGVMIHHYKSFREFLGEKAS
jgi:hypothetical protein